QDAGDEGNQRRERNSCKVHGTSSLSMRSGPRDSVRRGAWRTRPATRTPSPADCSTDFSAGIAVWTEPSRKPGFPGKASFAEAGRGAGEAGRKTLSRREGVFRGREDGKRCRFAALGPLEQQPLLERRRPEEGETALGLVGHERHA